MRGATPSPTRVSDFYKVTNAHSEYYDTEAGTIDVDGTQCVVACYDTSDDGALYFIEKTELGCRVQFIVNEGQLSREAFIESVESDFGCPFTVVATKDNLDAAGIVLQTYFTDEMIGARPRDLRHNNSKYMGAVIGREAKAFSWPNGSVTRAGVQRVSNKYTGNIEVAESLRLIGSDIVATDTLNFTLTYLNETYTVANGSLSGTVLLDWYF